MRVLVTGGAGFVGASLCIGLAKRHPDWTLVAFDNLRRRGSELNVPRLRTAGIRFVHGDVREKADLFAVDDIDAVVEASAEPSVLAGMSGGVDYLADTNLRGAFNCLELCRSRDAQLVFLSTSRVYPLAGLRALDLTETPTRFELGDSQPSPGASAAGIAEEFPLRGARTLYGATKLAAELLIAEYVEAFGVRAAVDRCGVIAGPWQMGKVDQGVFTFWLVAHHFERPLSYIGFGGNGKQVRDVLHVDDLVELIDEQLRDPEHWSGTVFNVGGGREFSLSLLELTELCRSITGKHVDIGATEENRPGDVPLYISDCAALFAHSEWRPRKDPLSTLEDTATWIAANEPALRVALD